MRVLIVLVAIMLATPTHAQPVQVLATTTSDVHFVAQPRPGHWETCAPFFDQVRCWNRPGHAGVPAEWSYQTNPSTGAITLLFLRLLPS